MKYNVRYDDEIINVNTQNVDPKGATSVRLLKGNSLVFDNYPNETIVSQFKIQFSGLGVNPQCLIIRKFVNP